MAHYKKLVGKKCYLSPMSVEDAELQAAWENDLEVALPLGDEAYTLSGLDALRSQVQSAIEQRANIFSIVDLESEKAIGRGMLFNLDSVNRSAMLGILIGEKRLWGLGYGQDATRLLLDYAFNLLNLNSVMLGTFEFNARAIQVYKKVGFREIGRRRQARLIAGRKYDAILMDILAEEFEKSRVKEMMKKVAN